VTAAKILNLRRWPAGEPKAMPTALRGAAQRLRVTVVVVVNCAESLLNGYASNPTLLATQPASNHPFPHQHRFIAIHEPSPPTHTAWVDVLWRDNNFGCKGACIMRRTRMFPAPQPCPVPRRWRMPRRSAS
jgi:hypothetical protein